MELPDMKNNEQRVLIESDWNLKYIVHYQVEQGEYRINRIRLEFKGCRKIPAFHNLPCINRIRLEFKGITFAKIFLVRQRINRIRLEFKVFLHL